MTLKLAYSVLDAIGHAILITNKKNQIIYINRHYSEITGYSPEEVIGKNPNVLSSGKQDSAFYQQLWKTLHSEGHWEGEIWNRKKSGELFPEWMNMSVIKDQDDLCLYYIGTFSDIAIKKEAEEKILHYAYYDPLTDLPNRRFFEEQLKEQIALFKRNKQKIAVLFIDLDDFKKVNDQFGHQIGDLYLCQFANLIKNQLRESDILARLGGDEFVIKLPDIKSEEIVKEYCQLLLFKLESTPISIEKNLFTIRMSLGHAIYPDDGLVASSLIECADRRMYKIKQLRKTMNMP